MSNLRPIAAIAVNDITPHRPTTGMPICKMVDPTTLVVDELYQRQIGEKGTRQIRKIVREFCWTRYKPPICAVSEHGGKPTLKVLDGQHTAIAAASNPHIKLIPVMVIEAAETTVQASAFVGQNTGRLNVTPLQLHRASVVAGDDEALTVEQVCERAGVQILTGPAGHGKYHARQTIAVQTIGGLIDRQAAMGARRILEVLANADLAPITTHHIRAAEYLMTNKDFKIRFDPVDLSTAIGDLFLSAEDDAKILSHAHRVPYWKALATVWFRKTRKRRPHLRIAA